MSELDRLYVQLLHVGFLVLRQASDSGNRDWVHAEIEMLHNVPILLGEENIERHRYYWTVERQYYFDWLSRTSSAEARSRMRTYYEPIWNEMEPLIARLSQVGSN